VSSSLSLHPRTKKLVDRFAQELPHALVIEGQPGTGVSATASYLASSAGSPAFTILPKKKVKNEWVVDMLEGSVVIDDIRQLYEQTRTRQPGQQVYIIDTGEKSMTIAAQNAFLKLLEEPRQGVHFIIATHQPDLLLPTIISRSQRLNLIPITSEQTTKLIDSLGVTDKLQHTRLAFVGQGLPALITRLANDNTAYEQRVAIMTDAKSMLGNDVYQKLLIAQRYKDRRGETLLLIDDMNKQLRTIIKSRPDYRLATAIDKHLATRERIATAGNIRLQLAADVL
jgi:DNA polymerase-3 subunit delta'